MNCVITGVSANNDTADNKLKKIAANVAKSLDGTKKAENIIMSLLNNNENYHLIEYIRTRLSDKDVIKQYAEEVSLEEGKFTANDYVKLNSNTLTRLLKSYYKEVIPSVENTKTNKAEGSLNGFLTGSAKTIALNHTADLIKDEYFMNQFNGKRVNRYDVLKTVNNKILNQFYTRVDNYVEEIINPDNTNYKENAKEDIDDYVNIREKIKEHKKQVKNIDTEIETIKADIKKKRNSINDFIAVGKEFIKNNDQDNAKRVKEQIDAYNKDINNLKENIKELYSKRDKLDIKLSIFNIDKYTTATKLINNHINEYTGVQRERILNYMNLVNQVRYNANEWYNQVYHNKNMTSILKQTEITEDIDEYLAGEDPGKDDVVDTANQENLDETSRSWEDSLYKSFDSAINGKLKLLIGQLYNLSDKYNENATEQALDTDNELGVATRMDVQKVINNIFSFADCSNIDSFINSIEHKSNTIYSLYGLGSLVHQMKQYRDLANFVFVNFSKPIVHKTMLTVSNIADENGVKFDYTNTTAFYKTANIFNLANSLRNTYNDIVTNDIDFNIRQVFGMFEITKNVDNLTEGVYNILKEFFPHIDKKAVTDAVININNAGNIEQLKGCINTLNKSVQKFKEHNNEEYVKIIDANRKVSESIKLAIDAKRAEYNNATITTTNGIIKSKYSQAAIDNAMNKFEADLRQEKESEYKDPSEIGIDLSSAIYSSLYSLNELIGDYIESAAKLNTTNAEGNSASDVVKNCFITRLFDKINGTFATDESKKATVRYFTQGIDNNTQNQYANNPLLFGLKDINGVVQVPGLIDTTQTGFIINNNFANGFTYSLFDGSKNSNTQNGKGYSKMSKFDFFITQFNAFKYGINEFDKTGYNDTINGISNAVYSMRIGSDAPKIYFIRAPKYNISQAKLAIYNHVLDELNMFISGLNSIFVEDGTQYVITNDITGLYDRLHYSDNDAKKLKAKGETDLTSAFVKDGKLVGKAFNFYRLHEVSDTNNRYNINEMMDELLSLYGGVDDHALFNVDVNGRFNLIPNNSIVYNGDKFELVLSQEQKEKLFNFVDNWCDAYLKEEEAKLAEFLQIFKDNNISYNLDEIDSYLLNTLNMNMNYDDLFEGDYKFYNKSRDFLKRTKESQAGGDSFAGYDITKNQADIVEDNKHNIEIETGTLNSDGTKSRNPIIINGKILKPRNGFKAITIYNTVSKSDVADDMQKQLYDDFIKQGDSHEKAYEKSVNIAKGFGFDNGDLTKTNDAQSYITFDEWIRRRFADGTISEYKDIISQLLDDNISIDQIDLSKVNARIQVDKNFYFDKIYDAETNMFVPRQIKNAEFVLIPKLLPTGSDLRKVYDFMVKHDIGQLNTTETSKAAKKNIFTIWGDNGEFTDNFKNMFDENGTIKNEDGFDNNYIENYYYQYLYKQQDVPEHIMNESNKAGSQIIKKILDNIIKGVKEDTQHYTDLQQRLHNFENAYAINIKKSVESFCDMMGWKYNHDTNTVTNLDGSENLDYSKFLERMREEGARLGMDSNFFDYCTDNGYGDTIMPNFMNINMSKLESVAQACFNRVITRQKLPGWHAAQITGVGYSNKLQFDVKTGTMKVYLPRWSNKIPKYDSTNPQHIRMVKEAKTKEEYSKLRDYEIFDKLLLKQLNDKGLDLHIGYRIPTEGKQSVANLKVVGFVNEALGSTIVVPNDWVTLTGSDFDVDSVYGISWEIMETKDKDGNVILDKVPFKEHEVDKRRLYIDYVTNKTKDRHLTNVKSIIDDAISDIKKDYNNDFHEKLNESNKAFAELNNFRNNLYNELPKLIQAKIQKYNSARQFNKNNKTDIYNLYIAITTDLHELTLKPNFTKLFNEEERNKINEYIDILNGILDLLDDREENPIKFDAEHYVSDVKDKIQEIKEQVQAERLKAIEQDAIANGMLSYQDFLKLDFLEQLGQRARNNFILDQMIGIMQDFSSREEQLGRSNFEKITNGKDGANDIISKLANEQGLFRTPYNVTDQLDYFDDVMGGARLKALSVVADNFCSRNNKIRAAFGEGKISIILENDVEEGAVKYNIDDIIKSYDYDVADYTIHSKTNSDDWHISITPLYDVDKKSIVKGAMANKYIGFADGIHGSSTAEYAKQAEHQNIPVNSGDYTDGDVIFVSIPGKRGDYDIRKYQQDLTIEEAIKALNAGATILTDTKNYIDNSYYNEGEKRLKHNLEHLGIKYTEINDVGVWNKNGDFSILNNSQKSIANKTYTLWSSGNKKFTIAEARINDLIPFIENLLNDDTLITIPYNEFAKYNEKINTGNNNYIEVKDEINDFILHTLDKKYSDMPFKKGEFYITTAMYELLKKTTPEEFIGILNGYDTLLTPKDTEEITRLIDNSIINSFTEKNNSEKELIDAINATFHYDNYYNRGAYITWPNNRHIVYNTIISKEVIDNEKFKQQFPNAYKLLYDKYNEQQGIQEENTNVQNKYAITGEFKIFNARRLGWSNNNKNLVDMYITTYTSQTTAHHLDAVKMGSIPNVNEYTFFVYKLFSMMGVDYENAIAFIRQPAITQLVKNYNLINSIFFNNNTQNPFNITVAELAQSLNLTFKYNAKSKPQPVTKDTSLYNVITALKDNVEFVEAFYDVFNIDISDSEVKDILKINIPLSRKQMFTRIKNSKDTDIYAKAFDFGMLLNFNQYQLTANHVNKLIRMTGVEKTGAAQTINENRETIRNIEDYIKKYDKSDEEIREEITSKKINALQKKWDKASINKTVTKDDIQEVTDTDISEEREKNLKNTLSIDNKSIISSIFTANPQDSTYKSLDSVFQYATVLSNKVNTQLFTLERPEMILIKDAIEQVFGKKLSKDVYKKYKKYFVNYLYQNAETKINTPVTVDTRGRILIDQKTINENNQKDTDYNSEKMRILGIGITTSGDINISDINNPTKKDIQRFNKLTPAQKVLFIQKHFTEDSGIFNYLNVTLLSRKKSLTDRIGRQYISYNDQINNIEDLYYLFRSSFYNHNPLIKLATIDLIKYAFIGEGFDFKTNYISKIIPNDVLYNSTDNGGLGIIDELKTQLEVFKNELIEQRKSNVIFDGNNTFNTFVDRFVRMNSFIVPKCTFNYNPYMDKYIKDMSTPSGIILIDARSENVQNASIFINKTGAYQETPNGFVGNHYIEISFQHKYIKDKKEAYFTKTTLYKIVKSSVDGCYFYIPMNKLNSYEYDENSYNSYNNKQFALNDLIEEVKLDEDIFINNHANNFIGSAKKDIMHSPVKELTNDTVHINKDNIQALNQISNDVNRYIAGGAIKMINEIKEAIDACYFYNKQGTIYLINNNNDFVSRFDETCDQLIYDDNNNEYIAHIEKLQDTTAIAQFIQSLFNGGLKELSPETQHDAEKRFHFIENEIANDTPLFASNYFKVSLIQDTNAEEARKADTELLTDEVVAPNISEDIIENITSTAPIDILSSSVINEIKYIANKYNDSAANYFMKGIARNRINTDSRFSLKENRSNIYKFAARYYITAANGIVNKLNHFEINGKDYSMDSTDFYKALIDNDEYFPEVSRIILDGITFGERISAIFNLDLSVEDEDTKKNIESIISSINKVRQNTKLIKAITKVFDVYMKKYATNPEIQEGILKLRETFGDTATFDKWVMDPAEINSAQVQVVMKHINSIFAKAELFDTKRNVEEFTKALDEIKKEQPNINFDKFIDSKTGKFKEDYTQQFIEDRNKLNKAVATARENRYNSIEDYGKYLKAKLARDKFYNKYTIQEINGDYYEKLNKLTENTIANAGDYFVEYAMLNEQLYDENLTKTETEEQTINRKKLIQQRLQELKRQSDNKPEKANKAAVWIKGYYKNKAKFRDTYYDKTVDDSFETTYNQYNRFIKEYNAKHTDMPLENKLTNSDYKEAYDWIKTNGYLSFEDKAIEQINNAFEKLIGIKKRNTGNYLAVLKRKKDIYDRYGRLDPRKLDIDDIKQIKKEEETSDSLIYATGIGEGHLIKATNKRGNIMRTKEVNSKFKKYLDAEKYKDTAKQYELIKKINDIIGKVIDKDTGRFNIAALANNDIVTSEERIALRNYYRELKAIRHDLQKNTEEYYKKNKDSSPFSDEIDKEAYNDAMTYYKNNLMNTKEGTEVFNILHEIDNGQLAPNFNLFGYTTVLDEDLIDTDKTEAIKFISDNITYDNTDYYEDAKRDALSKGTEYFNKWYEANHIYDSSLHRFRPLHIWTRMAAVPGSELDSKTKYNPSWVNIETSVKEEYRNPDYNEEDNNYKTGNGIYDNNLNLTPAEAKAKKLFKDTLNKYAYTYQGKRFVKKGYLPRERKQEIDAMWAAKQIGNLFGLSWYSNTESDNYKTNIGYIYDKEAEQPMLSLLKNKGVKQLQKYPDSTKYNSKEEYREDYNKVLKENQEIQKENEALDNAILNRDWEEVMKHFIHNATIYNSRQSAKPYLYLLMEDLKNNDAYKLKGIINKTPIKNREISTNDNEQFQTEKQKNTEFLITNFVRRVLYNQYHQNTPIRSVANFLQNLTSAKYMVFNLYGGIANVTTGKVNIAMEEFAGEYFGFKDIKKAEAAYVEAMPSIIANMYSETAGNITDAFIKEFNVVDFDSILQLPEGTNEIDKYLKRARNFTYSFQSMGEHYMQNTVLLAMLDTNKLYLDSNGNMRIGDFKDYTVEIEKKAMENAIKNDANLLNLYKTYRDSLKNNVKEKYEIITKNKDINREFLNKIKNSDSYKSLYKDIAKKYNAERKELRDKAKVDFAKNKTVKELFEFKDGKLNITNEAKTYFDNTVGKNKKNRTGSLEKLIGEFKEKVIFVNKKIHGVYDKNGAASIENSWWGSLVMQYHKHLYTGFMKRWRRRGYYSEMRGSYEYGAYQTFINFLTTDFNGISDRINDAKKSGTNVCLASIQQAMISGLNCILNLQTNYENLSEFEKANLRRCLGDAAGVLCAVLFVMALYAGWDDDELKDDGFKSSLLYLADRLYSETVLYSPTGAISEYKTTWSSPIASANGPSDFLKACILIPQALFDPNYNPEYSTGQYVHKNKLMVLLRRNIPGIRPYDRIDLITKNNKYYKVGASSNIGVNIGRHLGESIND